MSDLLVTRARPVVVERGELAGVLIPWDAPTEVADGPDGRPYTESWARGSIVAGADRLPVYRGHTHGPAGLTRGPLIGALVDVADADGGLTGRVELAATPDGQAVRELARVVGAHFSVEVLCAEDSPTDGTPIVRTDGLLTGLAVILPPDRPAYPSAQVQTVRSLPVSMTLSDVPPQPVPDDEPDQPEPTPPGSPTVARAELGEIVRLELARYGAGRSAPASSPLAQYESLGVAARAAYLDRSGELSRTIGRVLADQITTNNPGVVPPAWVKEVAGIVNAGRPTVENIGTVNPGSSGMEISYPYFAGDLMALVGVQATEKTPITSVRVDLLRGSAPLLTFAGGADLAYQLVERSEPAYLDAYLRIMYAAYAAVTDNYAADQLVAASDEHVVYDPATGTPEQFRAAVFAASVKVQKATGSPASVVLAAEDVFVDVGSALNAAPVQNATGTADARSLDVDVSRLKVVYVPGMAAGTAIVTNRQAAGWAEVGPRTISAEDVEKLGRNVAVWGLGAFVATVPKGIVMLSATAPVTAGTAGGRAKADK